MSGTCEPPGRSLNAAPVFKRRRADMMSVEGRGCRTLLLLLLLTWRERGGVSACGAVGGAGAAC